MRLFKYISHKLKQRKLKRRNRSLGGDILLVVVLGLFGLFSLFPLVYTVVSAFKPFSEIFIFPPRLKVDNPTLDNFFDLATIVEDFTVPLSRYIFNTLIITGLGTFGTVFLGSMAAFPLAKYKFPGSKFMGNIIVRSEERRDGDSQLSDHEQAASDRYLLGSHSACCGRNAGTLSDEKFYGAGSR